MPLARLTLTLLLAGAVASAQAPAPPKPAAEATLTLSQVLDRQLANLEREFVPAAEALPEEKFAFAPTQGEFKGVKTFAQQVGHVASANYLFAAGILGEKPPADLGPDENGAASLKTKADYIKYLKDSFTYAHKAFAAIAEANATASIPAPWGQGKVTRLGLASLTVAHGFDHYGQVVVYLRMNGIVPPASRK
ncbi:MAG: DinB family protein [Geothrix sp.]|uniref:DinB family protein n=1 Tax=Geothrix sp. TaxID=1962974 RepID=UPI00184C5173|nr:DinB family protein [Geothrix sp.]NWJ41878.1 DinB family protein [Geothrix sp.]WIL20149.1 MAG: DinB family protein [Geothrix sp.]